MKKIPPVWEACILKTNALDIKVSDQIANLEEAIANLDQGKRFFAKTHITRGLKDLMNEGIARLGGCSSQAIFHLKQAMGGGKTHLLTCMGLLARHPDLRKKICPDLHDRFPFDEAAVAAFNGRNFNTLFWEEIAQQLGRADTFKKATMHTPPDEADWLKLFADNRPCLILLDELPPYLSHHNSIASGKGSQADSLCQSFSALLTAASKKSNVCIILSDLHAAYKESGKMIEEALRNAQQEVGRQEKTIIPVDLTGQEIYAILRKTLFETLPDEETIQGIASVYAEELKEAGRSKTVDRSALAIADEIASTYPFHPKLKNLIALFKENEKFRQARGLIELISRLLRSVWERKDENAFLIGAEQFDFSIVDVRNAFETINSMPDVVANDIWDEKGGAVAQKFAPESTQRSGQKVASLLFTSSLSTSVNAIKGLSETDLLECLIAPGSSQDEFKAALQHLKESAWYLHPTSDGKLYFDKQENLAKKLQRWADDAPQPRVDSLKRDQLQTLFKPQEKSVYQEVLALPTIDAVLENVKKSKSLIIYDPDGKIPPERLQEIFETVTQKNNFCVLTGSKSALTELDHAARALYAIKMGETQLGKEKETEEFKERKKSAEHNFFSTLLALFNQLLIPSWDKTKNTPYLRAETIRWTRQNQNGFEGEKEITDALKDTGVAKFIPEIDYEKIRPRVERDLFEGEDRIRWNDLIAHIPHPAPQGMK